MKKLLTIIIIFLSLIGFAEVRPPVVTNTLNTNNFIWQTDTIWKDTLNYFWQISPTCYMIRHLDVSVWSGPFCFTAEGVSDSLIFEWDGIKGNRDTVHTPAACITVDIDGTPTEMCEGGTIVLNDSIFMVRKNPYCSFCWQYKYSSSPTWKTLYCENISTGRFMIAQNANDIFRMTYGYDMLNWVDSLHFRIDSLSYNRMLVQTPDSVKWIPIPIDSLYLEGWLHSGDTIPDQRDSLYDVLSQKWLTNGDSIPSQRDTITINNIPLTNRDSITIKESQWLDNADGIYYEDNYGSIGVGTLPDPLIGINVVNKLGSPGESYGIVSEVDSFGIGVYGIGKNAAGVYGEVTDGKAILGVATNNGVGVKGLAEYGTAIEAYSYHGLAASFTQGNVQIADTLKLYDGQVQTHTLKVGTTPAINVVRNMATMGFRSCTQEEWESSSQSTDTIYFIHE
jgi:hypothetical protein